jgi:hypothetical protein
VEGRHRRLGLSLETAFSSSCPGYLGSLALPRHACHVTVGFKRNPFGAFFEGCHSVFTKDHLSADVVVPRLVHFQLPWSRMDHRRRLRRIVVTHRCILSLRQRCSTARQRYRSRHSQRRDISDLVGASPFCKNGTEGEEAYACLFRGVALHLCRRATVSSVTLKLSLNQPQPWPSIRARLVCKRLI